MKIKAALIALCLLSVAGVANAGELCKARSTKPLPSCIAVTKAMGNQPWLYAYTYKAPESLPGLVPYFTKVKCSSTGKGPEGLAMGACIQAENKLKKAGIYVSIMIIPVKPSTDSDVVALLMETEHSF